MIARLSGLALLAKDAAWRANTVRPYICTAKLQPDTAQKVVALSFLTYYNRMVH